MKNTVLSSAFALLALGGGVLQARAGETDVLTANAVRAAFATPGQMTSLNRGPVGGVAPFKIGIRFGVQVSPRSAFLAGVDVSIPGLNLLPDWNSRVDLDYFVADKDGNPSKLAFGVHSLTAITFDQIYTKDIFAGSHVYIGGGAGVYIGNDKTRIGGKVFIGTGLTSTLGIEGTIHFAGLGEPLFTIQARVGL